MPPSTTVRLAAVLGFTLLAAGAALAEDTAPRANIALIDKSWAVSLDTSGFRVQADGVKPDSRRYFLATEDATGLHVSITLEAVSGQATEQGCLTHLSRIAQTVAATHPAAPARSEMHQQPLFELLLDETGGGQPDQRHLFACMSKENVYADIHLSQRLSQTGGEPPLHRVLESLTIVPAPTAGSLDHFRAGSAPYLRGQFNHAIPHYEQAIALERAHPVLSKSLWRVLVHNLGIAYAATGDLARAKATIEYGLSQDTMNPLFHYDLARTYAGMNERDGAMQALHDAFLHFRQGPERDPIPDPRQDVSFRRLMLDPAFRTLTESLMQPAI